MLPTSWWICKSFKLDDSVTNFIHPRYSRVKFLILFKSLLGLMGSMLDIFVYVLNFETMLQAAWSVGKKGFPEGVCGLTCFVRCFTLSFGSHKTPWTWEKTNYNFKCRCPSAFLSLSRPWGNITYVPQGWLWHGSCHLWGPGYCSEQGGLLSLIALCLWAKRSELWFGLDPTPLTPVTPWLSPY